MRTRGIGTTATLSAVLLSAAWALVSAQQRDPAPTPPTFRSGVELVMIDVGVVDRQGQPMHGLAATDFTVTVAGQPRRVVSAEYVDVTGSRTETLADSGLPLVSTNDGAGTGRLFVFIVDQQTLEPGNVRHVARAASRFMSGLTFVDRSSLLLMPSGPNVGFTWAHNRVLDALQRVMGQANPSSPWEFGSLSDARDIANRNMIALRTIGQRECGAGGLSASGAGFDPVGPSPGGGGTQTGSGPTSQPTGGGTPQGGGQTGGSGTNTPTGGGQTTGGGSTTTPRTTGGGGLGADSCLRDIQMRAEWAWRGAQMTSLASLSALRQTLASLEQVQGDKTIILISGGWPLDDREQNSLISTVASEAAAARATFFTLFVPTSTSSASRRLISTTPANDQWIHLWPLETLAGMTGGGSFRIDVGAESAFERLGRELSGFYRIGVEKDPADLDGKSRRMKVQVARAAVTVRAREIFDARTYADRDWAGRLSSALDAPIPATAIPLRVTSYLSSYPEDSTKLKVVLAGEASRLEAGGATVQVVVRDLEGKKLLAGEQPIGEPTGDGLAFSSHLPLSPGTYVIRVAVIDGAGRVGSVDHRVDVKPVEIGALSAMGPVLVRVPRTPQAQAHLALRDVRQDERLALQIELEGERSGLDGAGVVFEIASSVDGPSLVQAAGEMAAGPRSGLMLAQAVADMRVLPPGNYFARAKVTSGSKPLGEVLRAFAVTEAPGVPGEAAAAGDPVVGPMAPSRVATRSISVAPAFTLEAVLAPQVLGTFLDRVAARPDASSPMIHDLVDRARKDGLDRLAVSDTLAAQSAVAAFLRGLTLLKDNKLEHAANAFRSAMRASPDFYPAMVYLGACYAAGGNDKEAAGAWRTALIKEGDTLALHLLLADSLLRQDRRELALETLDGARARWPSDDGVKRRFVMAALLAGEHADGLQTLDELVGRKAEDEPALAIGLMVVYQAIVSGKPIETIEQDRVRMLRLAEAYHVRGGPSQALVDTWVAEVTRKQ
jgi:VWFA-related protein